MIGALSIDSQQTGIITTLPKVKNKIILSSVGGANEIVLRYNGGEVFLTKNLESSLWTGEISFEEPGVYEVDTKSTDGANNTTYGKLTTFLVSEYGFIKAGSKSVSEGKIKVYYYDPVSLSFQVWDGTSFGQNNPLNVFEDGSYSIVLPAGKYYFEVTAKGYTKITSKIVEYSKTTLVNSDFIFPERKYFAIGDIKVYLPDFFGNQNQEVLLKEASSVATSDVFEYLGKELPRIEFVDDLEKIDSYSFFGKPTVLAIGSFWLPSVFEQIKSMSDLEKKGLDINSYMVFSQDSKNKVKVAKEVGSYKLNMLSDYDGELAKTLNISTFPAYVFLDRKGVIKKIKMGILTSEDVIDNLYN
jgi:hypothetical protein